MDFDLMGTCVDSLWDETRKTWDSVVSAAEQPRDWLIPSLRPKRLWLRRANVPIAVTGRPGAGKTVLFDGLAGRVGGLGYRTQKSRDWERHRILLRGARSHTRAGFLLVPGQDSTERTRSLAKVFEERGAGPVGVIHVVCWGFNKVWDEAEQDALKEVSPDATFQGNEMIREDLLKQEVDTSRNCAGS